MLDRDATTVAMLQDYAKRVKADQVLIICSDAVEYLQANNSAFDIVFVDPPYQSDMLSRCCALLEDKHWLSNHAKIYLECDVQIELPDLPENWHCQKSKKAGQVAYQLYSREEN